jgi:hypothetical protein
MKMTLLAVICSLFTLTTLSGSALAASETLQNQNLNTGETKALKKGGNMANETKALKKGGNVASETKSLKKGGNVASETKALKKGGITNNQKGDIRGQAGDNIGTRPQGINQGK